MKVALATHGLLAYPNRFGRVAPPEERTSIFRWTKHHRFDGVDIGDWWFDFYHADDAEIMTVRKEVADEGLEVASLNCLRKCVTHPVVAAANRRDLHRAAEVAGMLGSRFLNVSLSLAPAAAGVPADRVRGTSTSPGASRIAAPGEFELAASFLRELAEAAGRVDVHVALELHHCSLADTSAAMLKLLALANHPNLSPNPDLGNVLWAYDKPEEPWYESVERLAGKVRLWHVKNIQRIYVPEVNRLFFTHATLDRGDIDYRWALQRLVQDGFDGYISIESAGEGDLLSFAARGRAYLQELLDDLEDGIRVNLG